MKKYFTKEKINRWLNWGAFIGFGLLCYSIGRLVTYPVAYKRGGEAMERSIINVIDRANQKAEELHHGAH